MSATRISRHVAAPRAKVYRALLDAREVSTWMVPAGMTSHVHAFDAREGGSFRISLTYDAPIGTGKTTAQTDTFHGRFVQLVPNERVVEVVEFETADPALRGEMTITIALADADGGTDILAVHDGLPPGLSPADNEVGWRMSLAKLAALVEDAIMTELPPAGFDREIVDYYERAPEESRLEHGAFQLEQARTRELIERHAPPAPAEVLDVGGAAGAYAFWLTERGYVVHLLDAVPRLVEEARRRAARASSILASYRVADARALPASDESMALVLLLGPLYHLVDPDDRRRALLEVTRVLRPGGVLIAAGISRWASALDGLARNLLADDRFARIVERDVRDGQHRNPTERLDYFTTAYFHRPAELRAEVETAGLTVEGVYGVEGPGWILPDLAERWNDPDRRAALLHVARLLEAEPAVLGCSAHLLVVGRKPAAAAPAA